MNPNELRALADALRPMAKAPCFDGIDIEHAADYLRACANAQPVAVPAGWKWVPVEPTPEMLSAVGMMDGYDCHAPGCSPDADHATWYSAMIAAAPAASQGEPKRNQPLLDLLAVIHCDGGHHTEAVGIEQSIKDALTAVCVLKGKLAQAEPRVVASFYTEDAELVGTTHAPIKRVEVEDDGTLHVFIDHWPQAEPKREPLSDERIAEEATNRQMTTACEDAFYDGARWAERAHGIGGSDER